VSTKLVTHCKLGHYTSKSAYDRTNSPSAPNFFLSASTKAIRANGSPKKLNFSNLRVVMVGGEANRTDVIETANEFLREHGGISNPIKAAYGLSEVSHVNTYYSRLVH